MEVKVPLADLYRETLADARGREEIGRMAAQEFVKLMPAMRDYAASGAGRECDEGPIPRFVSAFYSL
jgi:hypothetical protein